MDSNEQSKSYIVEILDSVDFIGQRPVQYILLYFIPYKSSNTFRYTIIFQSMTQVAIQTDPETLPQTMVGTVPNPQTRQCVLCLEQYKDSYTIDSCKHEFCSTCFHNYIETLINTGTRRLEKFKCPREDCIHLITERELEKELSIKMFDKISNKVLYQHTVLCPSCATRSDFMNVEEQWYCNSCFIEICKFCKSLTHEGDCQDNVAYFHEMRSTFFDNEEIGYCPECSVPFLKDENCDHVTCDNPDCAFEFCFFCSVSFSPINNHGSNFHRTDCRNYEDYGYTEPNYCEECTECQKLGTGCEPSTVTKEYFLNELIQKMEGLTVNQQV